MFKQKYVIIICCVFCFSAYAQDISPSVFAKLNGFRNKSFKENGFYDIQLGFGLFSDFWIAPKLAFKHNSGALNDASVFTETTEEQLRTNYTGNLVSIGTKIRLTNPEDIWLFFWPEYSFGNFKYSSSYFKTENNPTRLQLQESVNYKNQQDYFDFALGLEGYLDFDQRFLISAYLVYTTLDLRQDFDQLSFTQTGLRPIPEKNSSLGIGVSLEYHFSKK